jgi:hypothetical protein
MSEKKRTTVTTIETRELWVIRPAVPEPTEEAVTITPVEPDQPATATSLSSELNSASETSEE